MSVTATTTSDPQLHHWVGVCNNCHHHIRSPAAPLGGCVVSCNSGLHGIKAPAAPLGGRCSPVLLWIVFSHVLLVLILLAKSLVVLMYCSLHEINHVSVCLFVFVYWFWKNETWVWVMMLWRCLLFGLTSNGVVTMVFNDLHGCAEDLSYRACHHELTYFPDHLFKSGPSKIENTIMCISDLLLRFGPLKIRDTTIKPLDLRKV